MAETGEMPRAADWDGYWSSEKTQRFTEMSWSKRRILKVLDPYLTCSHTALDAGCGSGFFSKEFCDRGIKTFSLDYSAESLSVADAKTEGRSTLVQADLLEDHLLSKIDQRFDLIFTDGLFEHFTDREQDSIMNNLRSVLKPSGVIATFVPNKWSPWELIRPLYMPGINEDPFTLNQLVDLNTRNGLDPVLKGGLNVLPWAGSPDYWLGSTFGMLLFTVSVSENYDFYLNQT